MSLLSETSEIQLPFQSTVYERVQPFRGEVNQATRCLEQSVSLGSVQDSSTLAAGDELTDFDPHAILRNNPSITSETECVLNF